MTEIGRQKTVVVKTRIRTVRDGKTVYRLVSKTDRDGKPETRVVEAAVWRVTREVLGGTFCRDRNRKLVVGLVSKDMIAMRPYGTRQVVRANVIDIYRYILQCEANRKTLVRAREAKARRAQRLADARLKNAEKRLRNSAREMV